MIAFGICVAAAGPTVIAAPAASEKIVAYLDEDSPGVRRLVENIQAGLSRLGVTARHNVRVKVVPVDVVDKEALSATIQRLAREGTAVIVAGNSNIAVVAKSVAPHIPVVFASHQDPLAVGLAKSLARPGGNVTGFTYFVPIDQKRLELLRLLAPGAQRLGVVIDRWWLDESGGREAISDAREKLGFQVTLFNAESEVQLESALATRPARQMDAWYVPSTRLAYEHPDAVLKRLRRTRKPVVYPTTRFVESGGLVSYQQLLRLADATELFTTMIARVVDGVPAGDIPVERPKSFELAINVDAARQLGMPVSDALLKRADRVISGDDSRPR